MGWTTEGLEFESQYGQEFCLLHFAPAASGVHSGYRGLFPPWVKRKWREADYLPPTSADVSNNMNLYVLSPIYLHGVVLN
jgi:hypothetical protein